MKNKEEKTDKIEINDLYQDYALIEDIFNDEDERVHKVKQVIFNRLTESDRRIILLYTELQSLRKLGKALNVPTATAYWCVKEIKDKIISEL